MATVVKWFVVIVATLLCLICAYYNFPFFFKKKKTYAHRERMKKRHTCQNIFTCLYVLMPPPSLSLSFWLESLFTKTLLKQNNKIRYRQNESEFKFLIRWFCFRQWSFSSFRTSCIFFISAYYWLIHRNGTFFSCVWVRFLPIIIVAVVVVEKVYRN